MNTTSRLETIFFGALEAPDPAARLAYLDEACGEDQHLRKRVERMLQAPGGDNDFLESPARELAGVSRAPDCCGTEIGPYRLDRVIGEGGMGVVYAAAQTEPVQRQVALKIIKPGMDSAQVVARFEAERQALALMDHPNIAKVFEAGATPTGRPFFVMELVDGVPISQYCDEHQLTARQRLELFRPICEAVQHAHQKGIIHRDLKPSNVLVAHNDGEPTPKVIDFGVAKATHQGVGAGTGVTQLGQIVGTLEYMSPEQMERSPLDIDTRSDIYSLGVLLYELLTGTTPVQKETLCRAGFDEMRRLVKDHDPPLPSQRISTLDAEKLSEVSDKRRAKPQKLGSTIRGELDWIVMKALEKDRTRRYDTASALAADVDRYLANQPVEARSPSSWYRLRKLVQRNRSTAVLMSMVAVALIVSFGLTAWQAVRATQANRQAQTMTSIATAVNEFLIDDLLGQADPRNEPDRNVPLRTVLDRTAAKIDNRFADQPLVAAAVRMTLGKTYGSLGEYDKAELHFQEAVELYRATYGAGHSKTLNSMSELGKVYLWQGRAEQAERLQRDVLRQRIALAGFTAPETLRSMQDLAEVCEVCGRLRAAERVYVEALEAVEELFGPEHSKTLAFEQALARVRRLTGRLEAAEVGATRVLELRRRDLGQDHPDTLNIQNELVVIYLAQQRYSEAEKLAEEVTETGRRVLGDEHPETLLARYSSAVALSGLGRADEAEEDLCDLLETYTRVLGARHPSTLSVTSSLAQLLVERSAHQRAEQLLLASLDSDRLLPPAEAQMLATLIDSYERQNREQAAQEYRDRLERVTSELEFFLGGMVAPWRGEPYTYDAPRAEQELDPRLERVFGGAEVDR